MRQSIFILLTLLIFPVLSCNIDDLQPEIVNLIAPENVFNEQVAPVYFEIENPTLRRIEIRRVEFTFSSAKGDLVGDLNSEYAKTVVTSPSKIGAGEKESFMFGFTVSADAALANSDYPVRVNIRVYWNVGTKNLYKKFSWSVRPKQIEEDMPAARAFGCAGVIDETLYTFGGWENVTGEGHQEIYEYDIENDEWDTNPATLPDKRIYTTAIPLNDKIYIIGGYDTETSSYVNDVLVFDGETITVDGLMTESKSGVMAATDGTNIYIFGGKTSGDQVVDTIEKYTPGVGATLMNSTLVEARHSGAASIYNGKAYIVGGSTDASIVTPSATVEELILLTDSISQIGDLSLASANFGSCVRDGVIYMFGGQNDYKFQSFDMKNVKPMILGRILEHTYGSMSANSEDSVFNIGGWAEIGNLDMVHSNVYEYYMD